MEFLPKEIAAYAEAHTRPESDVLYELNRKTHLQQLSPQMLSGPLQGALLSMISHMIKPQRVLEIGTFTGYSAICLAAGLKKGGAVHTIDINEELEPVIKEYIRKAGKEGQIHFHLGPALEVIPDLDKPFDLVFIDADKPNYVHYFDLVIKDVAPGGFILADNVLWSGKVIHELDDDDAKALDQYNKKLLADDRVESLLLPVRDGIHIARKIG